MDQQRLRHVSPQRSSMHHSSSYTNHPTPPPTISKTRLSGDVMLSPVTTTAASSSSVSHAHCQQQISELRTIEARLRHELSRVEAEHEQCRNAFWRRFDEQQVQLKQTEGEKAVFESVASEADLLREELERVRQLHDAGEKKYKQVAQQVFSLKGGDKIDDNDVEIDQEKVAGRVQHSLTLLGSELDNLRTLSRKYNEMQESHDRMKDEYVLHQSKVQSLSGEKEELQRALYDMKTELAGVRASYETSMKDQKALLQSVENACGELRVMERDFSAAKVELGEKSKHLQALQQRYEEVTQSLQVQQSQYMDTIKHTEGMRKELETTVTWNRHLTTQMDQLSQDYASRSIAAERLRTEYDNLSRQLNQSQQELIACKAVLVQTESEMKATREEMTRARGDIERLHSQLHDALTQRQQLTVELTSLHTTHKHSLSALQETLAAKQLAEHIAQHASHENEELRFKVSAAQVEHDAFLEAQSASSAELARTHAMLDERTLKVMKLESELESLRKDFAELKQSHELVASELKDAIQSLGNKSVEVTSLAQECDKSRKSELMLKQRIASDSAAFMETKTQLTASVAATRKLELELEEVQETLHACQLQLVQANAELVHVKENNKKKSEEIDA
eukprot:PhF_6_TR12665/c0_g2_i2/m.20148